VFFVLVDLEQKPKISQDSPVLFPFFFMRVDLEETKDISKLSKDSLPKINEDKFLLNHTGSATYFCFIDKYRMWTALSWYIISLMKLENCPLSL